MAFRALHSAPKLPCRCVQRPGAAAPPRPQQRPAQRRQSLTCRAALTKGRSTASVADLKRSILSQAGMNCGLDKCVANAA
jgi:hypothetical protein